MKVLVHFYEENRYKNLPVAGGLRSISVDVDNEQLIPFKLREMGHKPFKIRNLEVQDEM